MPENSEITDALIEKALLFAESILGGDSGGHDMSHVLRVKHNAEEILKSEHADTPLVILCCVLHDVDDVKIVGETAPPHGNLKRFCADNALNEKTFKTLAGIIDKVSFSKNSKKDDSLDINAKIVQDADRLDALGAVGIARAFAYGGKKGRSMYAAADSTVAHFYDKLFKLPSLMNTAAAKALADSRAEYMKDFLAKLKSEVGEI